MSCKAGPANADPFSSLLPPRTPGSLGKCDAADPDVRAHPGSTPGSLGVNDAGAHVAYGSGGGGPMRMLLSLVMTATGGEGHKADPDDKAALISQLNFAFLDRAEIDKKTAEIAKSLGGQSHTNSVLSVLGSPLGARMLKAVYRSADAQHLDPRFVAAAFFAEADWSEFTSGQLDSFEFVGMDRFLKEYPAMVADGTLTSEMQKKFRRTASDDTGETGEHYHQRATFQKIEEQIEAFGGFLKHRGKLMLADLAAAGIHEKDLTSDEIDYWSYVYYNAGSSPAAGDPLGKGKQHLIEEGVNKSGLAAVHVPSKVFQSPSDTNNSMGNAQRMLMIKRLLEWGGMADPSDPSSQKLNSLAKMLDGVLGKGKK
jgi:hypothetical protein